MHDPFTRLSDDAMAFPNRMSGVARTVAILAVLALAAVIGTLVLRGIRAGSDRDVALGWERHTFVVLIETEKLDAGIRAAESAQRGYLLSGNDEFFADFKIKVAGASASVARLQRLTTDNPEQVQNLNVLRGLVNERLALLRQRAGLAHSLGVIENIGYAPGRAAMKAVDARLDLIRTEEERLLAARRAEANAIDHRADRINFLLASVGLVLVALAGLMGLAAYASMNRSRDDAARARVEATMREALEARVIERTEDLRAANARLLAEAETREAAEAQVRQMQKMESIGQLTGGIAHDFNNMLAIVIGSLDMARRRIDIDPAKTLTYIDNAEEGARRAAQLTARLLAFSRQQPLSPEPTDVNKLVGDTSELVRRTIGEQIRLETVLAGGLWRANVDRGQLENAILNLAVNARDAMPEGGKITLESANTHLDEAYAAGHAEVKPGQYVVICVTDTGIGMPADVIERAFDPFFTTKQVGKGTGLGLSQVFGFVKQSGGHLKIYSEERVGTTVKLYLPRWFGAEGDVASRTAMMAADMPRAKPHEIVLVVEDEQRVRHLTVDTLRELGYSVVQASDGEQALEQLRVQPQIDLLFTDIVMPGMNGRELADRALVLRPGLRVLYTTGYTRNAVVHNGMVDPGVSLLSKPFTMAQLAVRVRAMLDVASV